MSHDNLFLDSDNSQVDGYEPIRWNNLFDEDRWAWLVLIIGVCAVSWFFFGWWIMPLVILEMILTAVLLLEDSGTMWVGRLTVAVMVLIVPIYIILVYQTLRV